VIVVDVANTAAAKRLRFRGVRARGVRARASRALRGDESP
jgi:hypothetical protein